MDVKEKIITYSEPEPNTGCWLWTKSLFKNTHYARIHIGKKTVAAHRASYESFKGPIPSGLSVCHSCDIRYCVNPDHLWIGNNFDNMQDASKKGKMKNTGRKKRTHCFKGHLLSKDNIYVSWNGRKCKICSSIRAKKKG